MKLFIYTIATLVIIVGVVLVMYSAASRKQPELGLHYGQLRPCPVTPNCVCSEHQVESAFVEPLSYTTTAELADSPPLLLSPNPWFRKSPA